MSLKEKNPIKVLFYLSGDQNKASSRVRGFWIAEALEQINVQCTLRWKRSKLNLFRFALEIPRHDTVIFQKTYSRYHRWLMMLANAIGKLTYLDLDDAPSRTQSPRTLKNVESMMHMADGVFVGNQNLFDYAKQHQPNVYLIPSGINLKHYHVSEKKDDNGAICLGWIGNGAHYKRDLIDILAAPLRKLVEKYPLKFKLVGASGVKELHEAFGAISGLEIEFVDSIEWSDPNAVSKAIGDFDIGLFPLLPNDFNKFKCGFKALEYMATGIPVVASPIAINSEIVSHGEDGLLATSETDWINALSDLIESPQLRKDMGRAGRLKIESSFSVVQIAERIRNILDKERRFNEI
ncbi:glycosyltransferase family 4 protein [Pseudomonadota bacterium]